MNDDLIPRQLLEKCFVFVQGEHKRYGLRDLIKRLATKENLIAMAMIDKAREAGQVAGIYYKAFLFCVFLAAGGIVGALFLSDWFLWEVLIVVIIGRWLWKSERRNRIYIAASLLALEILANDFAGWGKTDREKQKRAADILGGNSAPSTQWLDFYLPRRNEIPSDRMQSFIRAWGP